MKQDRFVQTHQPVWERFEAGLDAPNTTSENLPQLYRTICQHLAIAEKRGYSLALVERLHALCVRGHQRIYVRRTRIGRAVGRYLMVDFPRRVRAEWRVVFLAALMLVGSGLIMGWVVAADPEQIYKVLSPGQVVTMEVMYDPEAVARWGRERESEDDFAMFGFYLRNNTSIGFRTFAGGLLFGLGTAFFLLFNGISIGATAGYLSTKSAAIPFWSFVSGHSAPEITAIVLSGAAGLRLGWSLLAPGRRRRVDALRHAADRALLLIYGAALLFLVAAIVEAYWSSLVGIEPIVKWTFGIAGWVLLWSYLLLAGRGGGR
ncbi:MAG: stage II sporulation protein M [Pseudomonadota bacterium]